MVSLPAGQLTATNNSSELGPAETLALVFPLIKLTVWPAEEVPGHALAAGKKQLIYSFVKTAFERIMICHK